MSVAAAGGVLVGCRSGKIKENVDMTGPETLASAARRETATAGSLCASLSCGSLL